MLKYSLFLVFIAIGDINASFKPIEFLFGKHYTFVDDESSPPFGHPYLYPWSRLIKEAQELEEERLLQRHSQKLVISTDDPDYPEYEFKLQVPKDVKPDNLIIYLKEGNIVVQGVSAEVNDENGHFYAKYFVQKFPFPPDGSVVRLNAMMDETRLLTIYIPIRKLLPISEEILKNKKAITTPCDEQEQTTEKREEESSSPITLVEEQEFTTEATTEQGIIRNKELTSTEDNKVTAVQENALDYDNSNLRINRESVEKTEVPEVV